MFRDSIDPLGHKLVSYKNAIGGGIFVKTEYVPVASYSVKMYTLFEEAVNLPSCIIITCF
jgi:hypothetical protein